MRTCFETIAQGATHTRVNGEHRARTSEKEFSKRALSSQIEHSAQVLLY